MSRSPRNFFGWSQDGVGLRVSADRRSDFAHEVITQDDLVHLDGPVFLGAAQPRWRFIAAIVVALIAATGLITRAFWMQIVEGPAYAERAERNRLRADVVPARRGIIRDLNGVVLADNVPSFDLELIPWYLPPESEPRDELLAAVGRETGQSLGDLQQLVASSTDPAQSLTVFRDLPYDRAVALQILIGNDRAFSLITGSKRRYPLSAEVLSLSHLLGYVGSISPEQWEAEKETYRRNDLIGKTGIESSSEATLRGSAGERLYEVDAHGRIMSLVGDRSANDGEDVQLALDLRLQRAAETALRKELDRLKLQRGAVIAMDPRDGSIRAIVSLPSYDNNAFSGSVSSTMYAALLKDESFPLLPRAWGGTYPSGSTIKPVIAVAALAEGIVTPRTTVLSTGGIRIGSSFFPDWKAGGHGTVNVKSAIAWSVNTFFYTVGGGHDAFVGLGVDRLSSWMKKFGLNEKTGVDLPGERPGFVPTKEWKEEERQERWYVGDTYNLSIGQGDLLVTPLQVASFTAAIANGGHLIQPHLVQGTGRAPGPALADTEVIKTVQDGMRETIVYGSGRALSTLPIPIAGKTGTAQWRNDRANHAWFTSYAPADAPELVVTVLIEEGIEGSSAAVPVARDVYEAWIAIRSGS